VLQKIGLAMLFVSISGAAFAGSKNPFRVETTDATLKSGESGQVQVIIRVPEQHHLYRDMMDVSRITDDASKPVVTGDASFPPGFTKPDPADPGATREQFDMDVVINVPVNKVEQPGTYTLKFEVSYQGCKKSLCWMPQTETVEAVVKAGEGSK